MSNDSNYSTLKAQQYLSLTDIAYNVLLEAIINQDFRPGAPISITSLAAQLKMSNTPVREALMRAHGEGLVTQKTNHGFIVTNVLTPADLHQLFEVRHVLEMFALNMAQITPEVINTMSGLTEQMRVADDGTVYGSYREYMALDHQFHRALVVSASNSFLLDAWEGLHVHLHLSRLYTGVGLHDRSESLQEHLNIVEALRRGSKDEAASLLSQHIKRVEKGVQTLIRK
jgi:DNA-binding GntR family transcriptional regulator